MNCIRCDSGGVSKTRTYYQCLDCWFIWKENNNGRGVEIWKTHLVGSKSCWIQAPEGCLTVLNEVKW